jgi:UDP-N-acetylmuramate--alanine ligase
MPIEVSPQLNESRTESRPVSRFAGRRVHFIGIGGCGMSGLARILIDAGAIVTGSEPKPNPQTFDLTRRGAEISRDQLGELLSAKTDLVVRTAAVPDWNVEYKAALRYGIPTIKYAELLGQVMQERFGIAVAGTHGKSTTTAMISYALLQCAADPSFVVGGTVPQLGGAGSRSGGGKAFVVEACEFDRSFHRLHPTVALITNIEEDHLDCYSGLAEIIHSFHAFASLVPSEGGLILANGQDPNVDKALSAVTARVERIGIIDTPRTPPIRPFSGGPEGQPSSTKTNLSWTTFVRGIENGCYCGDVYHDAGNVACLRLSIPGRHNLFNATAAVAACAAAGIDPARAAAAVSDFTGVDRRMTEVGRCNGAIIIDDYGHHPTEIRATLAAVREKYRPRRLLCVFQPHQHSRTRFLLDDFAASFAAADETIVPDIYFVRDSETERQRISSGELVERIIDHGQSAIHIPRLPDIPAYLRPQLTTGDVLITMGAGNVYEIAHDLAGLGPA